MKKEKKEKSGIGRLLEISGRKKWLLLASAIASVLHALLTMVPYIIIFYVLKELLKGALLKEEIDLYLKWAFGSILISVVLMFISGAFSHLAAFNILYELRVKIAEKLGKLSMGYVGNRSSGELKKILADDVERIEKFIAHGIPDLVKAVILPIIMLVYLFTVDWRLSLISMLPLVLLLFMTPLLMGTEERKRSMKQYHNSLEDMNANIVEFVRAMPVMKIFGQSATSFTKYSGSVNEFFTFISNWTKLSAPIWGALISFLTNALLPILALGLFFYFRGSLTLPVFFLFLILGVGYIRPIFALISLSTQLTMIDHGVRRMDEILFSKEEQKSGLKPIPTDFSLTFDRVNFSYVENIDVIQNMSFSVPQGSITAFVGPSGSGKSTAAQLIARFYDVNSGTIKLGDININELRIEDLMDCVAFVFQDSIMFYKSIYDNILMGMDRTKHEVIAAAKIANCHDFIMRLPEGYDTFFGDKGIHLSGGEQQRIQLASIVLKDAPVVILDEATAFSDPENESLIMKAFSKIIQNKTVIIIAHRLSTIVKVDQIVVFDRGEVNAIGRHEELRDSSELYKKMWNAHTRVSNFELDVTKSGA